MDNNFICKDTVTPPWFPLKRIWIHSIEFEFSFEDFHMIGYVIMSRQDGYPIS